MKQANERSGRRAYVFAGGGTGGHIYPALAIIEQLRAIDPDSTVHVLCSNRSIDDEILSQAKGIGYEAIPAMPLSKKISGLARFFASWGPSLRQTRIRVQALKETHDTVVLVAMGGFVAAPAARGAHCERIPVVLVNLDAVPGKANVLISQKASKIYSAALIQGYKHWKRVAPIVRSQATSDQGVQQARASFGLDKDTKTILITGGSQGARSITGLMHTLLEEQPQAFVGWQVIHQLGKEISDEQLEASRAVYRKAQVKAWVDRYIDDMGLALSAADLAIGRCGAGTVAESWGARVPSVFFPYPYHKDEHQRHNARVLVEAGAAILCDDQIEPRANYDRHHETMVGLLCDAQARRQMLDGFETLGAADGAATIACGLVELADSGRA